MDEFRAQFYGSVRNRVATGKNPAPDAVAGFEDRDLHASAAELGGGSKARHARTDDDDIGIA
jgi:hypothetical protein